jgi:hypothetical protein
MVEITVGKPVAFNCQVKVPRLAGVVALGLLKKLKEPVNSLVEVLPLSDGVAEVDPVVVFANVTHDYGRESTVESTGVNIGEAKGPTARNWRDGGRKAPCALAVAEVDNQALHLPAAYFSRPRKAGLNWATGRSADFHTARRDRCGVRALGVRHLVEGSGMQGGVHDNNSSAQTMWHSVQRPARTSATANLPASPAWVRFDFAPPQRFDSIHITEQSLT